MVDFKTPIIFYISVVLFFLLFTIDKILNLKYDGPQSWVILGVWSFVAFVCALYIIKSYRIWKKEYDNEANTIKKISTQKLKNLKIDYDIKKEELRLLKNKK